MCLSPTNQPNFQFPSHWKTVSGVMSMYGGHYRQGLTLFGLSVFSRLTKLHRMYIFGVVLIRIYIFIVHHRLSSLFERSKRRCYHLSHLSLCHHHTFYLICITFEEKRNLKEHFLSFLKNITKNKSFFKWEWYCVDGSLKN